MPLHRKNNEITLQKNQTLKKLFTPVYLVLNHTHNLYTCKFFSKCVLWCFHWKSNIFNKTMMIKKHKTSTMCSRMFLLLVAACGFSMKQYHNSNTIWIWCDVTLYKDGVIMLFINLYNIDAIFSCTSCLQAVIIKSFNVEI